MLLPFCIASIERRRADDGASPIFALASRLELLRSSTCAVLSEMDFVFMLKRRSGLSVNFYLSKRSGKRACVASKCTSRRTAHRSEDQNRRSCESDEYSRFDCPGNHDQWVSGRIFEALIDPGQRITWWGAEGRFAEGKATFRYKDYRHFPAPISSSDTMTAHWRQRDLSAASHTLITSGRFTSSSKIEPAIDTR